jgi:predicted nucleic acid-binding Zn ribbon protein
MLNTRKVLAHVAVAVGVGVGEGDRRWHCGVAACGDGAEHVETRRSGDGPG